MTNFVFTCPATELKVQYQLDDDPYLSDNEYDVIVCPGAPGCISEIERPASSLSQMTWS
jgi:hypothetical protein